MSETASTVIKLLSSLTSPRAAVKYLTVSACVYFAWRYFEGPVRGTGIPDEQLSIVLILLGVGVGSIVGHGISEMSGAAWDAISNAVRVRRESAEAQKRKILDQEARTASDERFQVDFAATFNHLLPDQKKILRELTISERNVTLSGEQSSALKKNGYIIPIVNVTGSTYLTNINPLIEDFVKSQWATELEQRVDEFFEVHGEAAPMLLNLLKEGWEEAKHTVSSTLFDGFNQYGGCVRVFEDEDERCISLWFDDYVQDLFEQRTGDDYDDEAWISLDRVIPNKGAA